MKLQIGNNIGNKILREVVFILVLIIALIKNDSYAQTPPVQVQSIINPPQSAFISDYYAPGSKKWAIYLTFKDFNEPSWPVFIKIKIEGPNLVLESKPDYKPHNPITLYPGVTEEIAGDELMNYLDYNNLIISGSGSNELLQYGRMPEGFYQFTCQVLDYNSNKLISNISTTSAFINLAEPPIVSMPQNGSFISTAGLQNILIQWQLPNPPGGSLSNIEFRLDIYEITDSLVDPMVAIASNLIQRIYFVDHINTTFFRYDMSCPPLQIGKRYVYTIRAVDLSGRASFKNDGYSAPNWFYYGYPANGHITLYFPPNNSPIPLNVQRIFRWSYPSNKLPNQPVRYKLTIAKILEGQMPDQAIDQNAPFYEYTSSITYNQQDWSHMMTIPLDPAAQFAWQVKAYSEQQEVAKSHIYTVVGPPAVTKFYVKGHEVEVTSTYNADLNNLSGEGDVIVSKTGETAHIYFSNIKLKKVDDLYWLDAGEIYSAIQNITPIPLISGILENGQAFFIPDTLRLEKVNGLMVKGLIKWNFPIATTSNVPLIIESKKSWFLYNTYEPIGDIFISKNYNIPIAEPYNFWINLNSNSYVGIIGEYFFINLFGSVKLPSNVRNMANNVFEISFNNVQRIKYFICDNLQIGSNIKLANNTTQQLKPLKVIFDFSDINSPLKFSNNLSWKGAYFEKLKIVFPNQFDNNNQIIFMQDEELTYQLNNANSNNCYVNALGLQLQINETFNANTNCIFNSFQSEALSYKINIVDNVVVDGYFKGKMKIPFISATQDFTYTAPLTHYGYQPGTLDQDFSNYQFTFNQGQTGQEVGITVHNAVFVDKERLEMGLDFHFQDLGLNITNVTGFKAWGNKKIGFNHPNGSIPLTNQMNCTFQGYNLTMRIIGCGSSAGYYSFGVSGNLLMGSDISGQNGPPVVNFYSMMPSPLLDPNDTTGSGIVYDSTYYANMINNLNSQINNLNNLGQSINNLNVNSISGTINNLQGTCGGNAGTNNSINNIVGQIGGSGGNTSNINTILEKVENLAQIIAPGQVNTIQNLQNFVTNLNTPQVDVVWIQLNKIDTVLQILIQQKIGMITDAATDVINQKTQQINQIISNQIYGVKDNILIWANTKIDSVMQLIKQNIINLTQNPDVNVAPIVNSAVDAAADALKTEIANSLNNSVQSNLVNPITDFIGQSIGGRINQQIEITVRNNILSLINNGLNAQISVDFNGLFADLQDSITQKINMAMITGNVKNFAIDFINGIDLNAISNNIINNVKNDIGNLIAVNIGLLNNQINGALNALAQQFGVDINMDFGNLASKLMNGQLTSVYALDPVYIKVVSAIADFEGMAKFTDNDPLWGDSWHASLSALLKIEPSFTVAAEFISGKAPSFNYWFLQVSASGAGLNIPVAPTPLAITGISGKVYHHMNKGPNNTYYPDINVSYGAGLGLIFKDIPTNGFNITFDVNAEITMITGGFNFSIDGNFSLMQGKITGTGYLSYSTINKTFIGIFNVTTHTDPFLCGNGEMGITIRPNYWNVYLGREVNPITLRPICPLSLTALFWLDATQAKTDIGLKINTNYNAESPKITISGCDFKAYASLYYYFTARTVILWQPKFKIQTASIAFNAGMAIGVRYDCEVKSGNVNFASVQLAGSLLYESPDSGNAKVSGSLSGSVTVICIHVGFSVDASHTFS